MQDELRVQPGVALEMLVLNVRVVRIDGVQLPQVAAEHVGFELKVLAVLDIAETVGGNVLGQTAGDAMPVLRPESRLVGMGNIALQDDSPRPGLAGSAFGEIQAGEGNAYEHHVSERSALAPAIPHGVERVVGAVLFAVKSVGLDAEGIAAKQKRPPLIVEGIEHQLDKIVVPQRIARQHVPTDETRLLIFTNERREEVFVRVAQICDGRLGDRHAVIGITLNEVADAQHFACRR